MKKNKEKGITLIALIVTIIILLILVGTAIAMLTGENGLLKRTSDAKEKTQKAQYEEELNLCIMEMYTDKLGDLTIQKIIEELPLYIQNSQNTNDYEWDTTQKEEEPKGIYKGYNFYIDTNKIAHIEEKATGIRINIETNPSKYTNKNVNAKITIKSNFGIKSIKFADGNIEQYQGEKEVYLSYSEIEKNTKYTFEIEDLSENRETKTVSILNIDKLEPEITNFNIESIDSGFKIGIEAIDLEATDEYAKSGIDYYEYYVVDSNNNTTKYDNSEITGLPIGTYQIYAIAYDKAGNSKKTDEVEKKITVKFQDISCYNFNLELDEKGNLWGKGNNQSHQLGDITSATVYTSMRIAEGIKFKEISAGSGHSLAIDEQGKLWGWGVNTKKQVDYNVTTVSEPIKIQEGINFKKISAGNEYSLAIDEEGHLWGWGNCTNGKIGNGEFSNVNVEPTKIKEEIKFKEISASKFSNHSLAIDEEGYLWAWGWNDKGQLGNGTTEDSYIPIKIKEDTKFNKIIAADRYSLAIDEEGYLWTWGYNQYGRLGNGTTENSSIPIKIKEDTKFIEISARRLGTSLAIDEKGFLWTWGNGSNGVLGNGTTENSTIPIKIKEDTKFKKISGGYADAFAIDEKGDLWGWGANGFGQLGEPISVGSTTPIQIY